MSPGQVCGQGQAWARRPLSERGPCEWGDTQRPQTHGGGRGGVALRPEGLRAAPRAGNQPRDPVPRGWARPGASIAPAPPPGTSNWSEDYFSSTSGVGLVVSQRASGPRPRLSLVQEQLRQLFERDWSSRYAVGLDGQAQGQDCVWQG